MLNQWERVQYTIQSDAGSISGILKMNIQVAQNDQLRIERRQGFQDRRKLTEKAGIRSGWSRSVDGDDGNWTARCGDRHANVFERCSREMQVDGFDNEEVPKVDRQAAPTSLVSRNIDVAKASRSCAADGHVPGVTMPTFDDGKKVEVTIRDNFSNTRIFIAKRPVRLG